MTARGSRARIVFALAAIALSTRTAHAGDPYLQWFTVETPHFRVHYHAGLEELAQRTATLSETVRERLVGPVGRAPPDITHVLLEDESDAANGSASGVPYNAIRLVVSAPDDLSPLADYDDWSLELLTHEQTHIFHIDNISGPAAIINALVGKTYAPNEVQPHWLLEGLAVAMESKFTSGGRLRSSQFDMYLRADVLEDNVAGLDEISHDVRRWPSGDLWYLYGGRFYGFILDTYGLDTFAAVAADYGNNPIPWGINRAIRRATGRTYPELYRAFVATLKEKYRAEADAVRSRGLREGTRLTHGGRVATSPRFIPRCARTRDGEGEGNGEELLYFRDDGQRPPGFYRLPLVGRGADEGRLELVTRANGNPRTAAFDADCGFVFDSVAPSRRFHDFDDLFRQALGHAAPDGHSARERLTEGLRARSPDVSADGRRIAFVTNHVGTTTLRIADVSPDGGIVNARRLVASAQYEQAYTPRFSPDGTHVAYSAWTRGGYRDVRIVDVASGNFIDVTHDRALDVEPSWTPDGRTVLFSSDRTGIANVYAYDVATRTLRQVTNVVNGAYMPEASPDGKALVYVGYTSKGFDLFSMPLDVATFLPVEPYVDAHPAPPEDPSNRNWPVVAYNPLPTLGPYTYSVNYASGVFGPAFTLGATGSDIVGNHSVAANLTYYSRVSEVTGSLAYSYNRLPVALQIEASRSIVPAPSVVVEGKTIAVRDEVLTASTGLSYTLPGEFDSQTVSLAYSASHYASNLPAAASPLDPDALPVSTPFEGFLGSVHAGWSYSNAYGSLYGIGNERGFSLSASSDFADLATGSQRTLLAFQGRAIGYLLAPWLSHHVFALALSGGASTGTFPVGGLYYSGGFADQNALDAAVNGAVQSAFVLRGYPPGAFFGRQYNLANLEYRFPIAIIERGVSTLPFLLRTLAGTVFCDYGGAYDEIDAKDPLRAYHVGLGGELSLAFTLGYFLDTGLRFGVAKGFGAFAVPGLQSYLVAAATF